MHRRIFLTSSLAVCVANLTRAQSLAKVYPIGVLCPAGCEGSGLEAFRMALRELGYVEGRTVAFEYRAADGDLNRLPALATALAQVKVDLIYTTFGTAPPLAAKHATTTIPVSHGSGR